MLPPFHPPSFPSYPPLSFLQWLLNHPSSTLVSFCVLFCNFWCFFTHFYPPVRAQKQLGLVGGTPNYDAIESFKNPDVPARNYKYSSDGRFFAFTVPSAVFIYQAESSLLLKELPLPNILEINFSPRGTYLSTWERPVKLEDGAQHKNLRVFSVDTGEELVSFTQKSLENWDLQYMISESHAVRLVGQEVQVFRPAEWSKGVVDKLKVEGATSIALSPGLNPSVAVFVAEKKVRFFLPCKPLISFQPRSQGQPASVKTYSLMSLAGSPTSQKTFFKADRSQIKWNTIGTQVLVLTQTDVDQANKSYYGETGGLYLLTAAGTFDCRVPLDQEGPVHDFAWSPNSREFIVSYGCESQDYLSSHQCFHYIRLTAGPPTMKSHACQSDVIRSTWKASSRLWNFVLQFCFF